MNGVTSAMVPNSTTPMTTMNRQPAEKLRSRNSSKRMNGVCRRQRMREEEIEAGHRHDRFGDDLGRAEPAELLAAVEHQLQRADADRERGKAEPVEAAVARLRSVSCMNTIRPSTVKMPIGRLMKNTQCQL